MGKGQQKYHEEWTDCIGQTYRKGDTIAVAVASSSSASQVVGVVLSINKRNKDGSEITSYENGKIVPSASVTVRVQAAGSRWGSIKQERQQTYQHASRVVKVKSGEITENDLATARAELREIEESLRSVDYEI